MITKNLSNQLIPFFTSLASLEYTSRIKMSKLKGDELIIAIGLNTLVEELSYKTVLNPATVSLVNNLADLIIANKSEKDVEEVAKAIKSILNNHSDISRESSAPSVATKSVIKKLSPKELLIMKYISLEYSSKDISDKIGMPFRSVESVRARIIKKLGVKNSVGIGKYAVLNKLI